MRKRVVLLSIGEAGEKNMTENINDLVRHYSNTNILENDLEAINEMKERIEKNAPVMLEAMNQIAEGVMELGVALGEELRKLHENK
jgi:hypothetical protein